MSRFAPVVRRQATGDSEALCSWHDFSVGCRLSPGPSLSCNAQLLPQMLAPAVDARAHRAERAAHDLGDLLVGEPLDITQHHGSAKVRRQGVECLLQVSV